MIAVRPRRSPRRQAAEVELGEGQTWQRRHARPVPDATRRESSLDSEALKLLADLGPFKLAYLEALLRAADVRASQKEAKNA